MVIQTDGKSYPFALLFIHFFPQLTVAHTQISRQILIARQYMLKENWTERGRGLCLPHCLGGLWHFQPCLLFVSTIRAHAAYQHPGVHNKLHVVLYSKFDWCCVYVLCVRARCTQWSEREREEERETERESLQNGRHTQRLAESTVREGIWSSPCLSPCVRLHFTCLIKGTQLVCFCMGLFTRARLGFQ